MNKEEEKEIKEEIREVKEALKWLSRKSADKMYKIDSKSTSIGFTIYNLSVILGSNLLLENTKKT